MRLTEIGEILQMSLEHFESHAEIHTNGYIFTCKTLRTWYFEIFDKMPVLSRHVTFEDGSQSSTYTQGL